MSSHSPEVRQIKLNLSPGTETLLRRIRILIGMFVLGLVLAGVTAIPLEWQLNKLAAWIPLQHRSSQVGAGRSATPLPQQAASAVFPFRVLPNSVYHPLAAWIHKVRAAVVDTNARYPFLAYGTDWLAFGHFVIAVAFIGPWRDPVKNRWVLEWGLIASILVIPWAMLFGYVRGIPWGWQVIDCLFGLLPLPLLWYARKYTKQMETVKLRKASDEML